MAATGPLHLKLQHNRAGPICLQRGVALFGGTGLYTGQYMNLAVEAHRQTRFVRTSLLVIALVIRSFAPSPAR
jgi:hypothetical protein